MRVILSRTYSFGILFALLVLVVCCESSVNSIPVTTIRITFQGDQIIANRDVYVSISNEPDSIKRMKDSITSAPIYYQVSEADLIKLKKQLLSKSPKESKDYQKCIIIFYANDVICSSREYAGLENHILLITLLKADLTQTSPFYKEILNAVERNKFQIQNR